jgi:hypothetical protein
MADEQPCELAALWDASRIPWKSLGVAFAPLVYLSRCFGVKRERSAVVINEIA